MTDYSQKGCGNTDRTASNFPPFPVAHEPLVQAHHEPGWLTVAIFEDAMKVAHIIE